MYYLFWLISLPILHLQLVVFALQHSNSSVGYALSRSNSSYPSATITTGPSTSSSGCPPCLVFASEGGANMLSKVVWYETPVPVTLDTVSVILSEYRNTTITSSTTVHGDVQKLNGSQVPAEGSLRQIFTQVGMTGVRMQFNNYYASMGPFVLANGTDGALGGGTTSIAYPTPYLGINGFMLFTSLSRSAATAGKCLVSSASELAVVQGGGSPHVAGLGVTTIILNSTYYSPIPGMALTGTNVPSIIENFYEHVGMDTSSFSAFLQSNTALMSSFPVLASCLYQPYGFGPPAFKIPVSALTATTTTTKQFTGNPPGNPAPGNPVTPPIAPQTTPPALPPAQPTPSNVPSVVEQSKLPSLGPSTQEAPIQNAPVQYPPADQGPTTKEALIQNSPIPNPPADQGPTTQEAPIQNAPVQYPPADQGPTTQASPVLPPQGQESQNLLSSQVQGFPNQVTRPPGSASQPLSLDDNAAAPLISYAGERIQPDKSTKYVLPGIGPIQAGGSPVTTNDVVYSLAPSATAIHSDGIIISITPAANEQLAPPSQPQVLTIGDSAYTADSSSNFVIDSQTLSRGSPGITVLGTPISLASGGSVAVVGSRTIPLFAKADDVPSTAPILAFGGATYIANTPFAVFNIAGQTLQPGGSVTISGTPLVYPSTGGAILIGGTSTQQLLPLATIAPQPPPVMTFGGNVYTANSASAFDLAGQTLLPGGSVIISGTPLVYPSTGGAIVIGGTSTQQLLPLATIAPQSPPMITFGGSVYTANSASVFDIAGQTLTQGGMITVSGTPVSYARGGSDIIISTTTEPLGSVIMNGFGTGVPSRTGTSNTGTSSDEPLSQGSGTSYRPRTMLSNTILGAFVVARIVGLL